MQTNTMQDDRADNVTVTYDGKNAHFCILPHFFTPQFNKTHWKCALLKHTIWQHFFNRIRQKKTLI